MTLNIRAGFGASHQIQKLHLFPKSIGSVSSSVARAVSLPPGEALSGRGGYQRTGREGGRTRRKTGSDERSALLPRGAVRGEQRFMKGPCEV